MKKDWITMIILNILYSSSLIYFIVFLTQGHDIKNLNWFEITIIVITMIVLAVSLILSGIWWSRLCDEYPENIWFEQEMHSFFRFRSMVGGYTLFLFPIICTIVAIVALIRNTYYKK